jgi:hypothetical protein
MLARIPRRFVWFTLLAVAMSATRLNHAGTAGLPPDASWAVFFISGFYLAGQWRWALGLLLIEAVALDGLAIRYSGISNYCATLAYWFVVPAYSVLWLGGAWLSRHYRDAALPDLARLCASLLLSVTLCYLITNASSYWLGGRIAHPDLAGWWSHFTRWYGHFLVIPCVYVGLAALVHVAVMHRSHAAASQHAH